jgi:tripartite-type tricarboxylate transporter receptor subunit TctC
VITDLLAGVLDFAFVDTGNAANMIKGGKLKGIALTLKRRSVLAPDVPTFGEAGLPAIVVAPWVGILAPANIPKEAQQRLTEALMAAMAQPSVRERITGIGLDPEPLNSEGLAATISEDIKIWVKLLKDAGVQPE